MISLKTANLPSHRPPRSPDFTQDATFPCLVCLVKSRTLRDTVNRTRSISQFGPTWQPRSRVSCHTHTHAHTHETARLPTDTLQNICEQDTKEEAEVGGDMKTVCACPGWLQNLAKLLSVKKRVNAWRCFAQTCVKQQWLDTHGWQGDTYNSGPVQTAPGAHPGACTIGIRSLYWG